DLFQKKTKARKDKEGEGSKDHQDDVDADEDEDCSKDLRTCTVKLRQIVRPDLQSQFEDM
ncbi:hypothetical protein BGX20_006728, partial [Mortierella sp. AD010]